MSFSPNIFLANIRSKDGLAKPSRFEIILPIPNYVNSFISNSVLNTILNLPNSIFSDISGAINNALGASAGNNNTTTAEMSRYLALQCENASLPGKDLQTADVRIYGPSFKVPYRVAYQPMDLTFLCTNQFEERKLFDRWMECISPTDTNNLRFPKGDGSNINGGYMTNITVIQYDDFIKQIYAVELIDAFPIGIAAQALNWGSNDFHRLQVQFAYQSFRTIYKGKYDAGAAAAMLAGTAAARTLPLG
jgi:hypothetical protein